MTSEKKCTLFELRNIIENNPRQVLENLNLQNQIIDEMYDGNLKLSQAKILEVFPCLQKNAIENYKLARVIIFKGFNISEEFLSAVRLNAEEGSPLAQVTLGIIYYKGWAQRGTCPNPDHEKAIKWLTMQEKDPIAQNILGLIYNRGWTQSNGSQHSPAPEKALEYFTLAANQKYPPAQNNLGLMYQKDGRNRMELNNPQSLKKL